MGRERDLKFADVRTDNECVEVVAGAVAPKGKHDGAIGPAFVDVDPLGVKCVGGDDKIMTSGSGAGELDGLARLGQEVISVSLGDAKVTGDDDHRDVLRYGPVNTEARAGMAMLRPDRIATTRPFAVIFPASRAATGTAPDPSVTYPRSAAR